MAAAGKFELGLIASVTLVFSMLLLTALGLGVRCRCKPHKPSMQLSEMSMEHVDESMTSGGDKQRPSA